MKEFRHIMMIFALVALAAGCSKVEVVNTPEREISFTVGSYAPATKAVAVTEFTSFKSKGYLYAEGVTGAQDFFGAAGETITFNGTDTWAPSHPYYWPKSANSYINFVSWYDKNGEPTTSTETSLVWEIDGTNRTLASDDNILWADAAWRYNTNTVNAAQYDGDAITEGVPTLFHHALAQVKFQAKRKAVTSSSTFTITVNNFRLTGVYTTGSLSLTNSDPGTTGTKAWTTTGWATSGSTTFMNGKTGISLEVDNEKSLFDMQSVIPQNNGEIKAEFTYTLRTQFDANNYIEETVPASVNLSSFTGDSGEWAMNHKITYTIIIDPQTYYIELLPTLVEDWPEEEQIVVPVKPDED